MLFDRVDGLFMPGKLVSQGDSCLRFVVLSNTFPVLWLDTLTTPK